VREAAADRSVEAPLSFDDFYAKERRAVVGFAYALSGNRWVAEDLAQDAFLAAHRDWMRIATYEDPGAWVRRVVVNLSVSAFRRRISEAKALARAALGQSSALPELSAESAEFWRAVRSLPRRRAQVVALYYVGDLPIAEIGRILGMAPGTVKKTLHDGRRVLARKLALEEET
jgi:RNA polymerase sigma-70 factor, ECF subfamily